MPKKNRQLPIAQRQELRRQLAWDTEEFDVEVLDGPHPESPTGRWRVVVALGKRKVVLFQPERGHIKLDARSTVTRGGRPSTKTSDINKAITRAQKFLLTVRLQRAAGDAATERLPYVRPEEVSVGFIHDLFRSNGLDTFEPKFRKNLSLVMDLVEAFASRGFDPGQIDDQWVKSFIAWRTAKPITLRRRFSNGRENTVTLQPVSPVTALANVKDYDQVLEYAHRLRRGARKERLISTNPLRNIKKWPKHEKALRECASDELYELLMVPTILLDASGTEVTLPAPVDVCDRSGLGILRTVVALKYHTARRREAVLGLNCGDVLTSRKDVRGMLRRLGGAHRSDWADRFEHGAILFRGELDKNGYARLFPMSSALRRHIDAHLARLRASRHSTGPDAPLFPRMTTALQSASVNSLYKVRSVELRTLVSGETKTRAKPGGWYTEALYLARSYLERQGHDADRAIPMEPDRPDQLLRGFKAHAWRRLWATKLERLGYGKSTSKGDFDLDRHVNFMGSWTILGGGIREERYVRLDPGVLVAISRFEDATRFLKERARFEEKRTTDLLDRVAQATPPVAQSNGEETA